MLLHPILLLIIVILSFFHSDVKVGAIFSLFGIVLVYHFVAGDTTNSAEYNSYYVLGAVLLWGVHEVSRVILKSSRWGICVSVFCLVGIILNSFGLSLWYSYQAPILYNLTYLGLYVAVIVVMLSRGIPSARTNVLDRFTDNLCHNLSSNLGNKGKIK